MNHKRQPYAHAGRALGTPPGSHLAWSGGSAHRRIPELGSMRSVDGLEGVLAPVGPVSPGRS
eukprot:scaffold18851_cov126-Isochrysis_galbana.AAC.3